MTDLLTDLDRNAQLSLTVEHEIRDLVRGAVFLILDAEGDVDWERVRPLLPEYATTGATPGNTYGQMVRSGEIVAIPGRFAELGNVKHRAVGRPIKVYRRGTK